LRLSIPENHNNIVLMFKAFNNRQDLASVSRRITKSQERQD